MISFVLRRLLSAVPTVFVVVTISFFLMRFAPGGPFNLERPLPPQTMANIMATYKLDQPLWRQYVNYLGNAVTGDFGPSFIYKDNTVSELIGKALPYSIQLGGIAILVALIGGVLHGPGLPPEKKLGDLSLAPLQATFAATTFGPALLLRTPHSVVATGHHRAGQAIKDLLTAFTARSGTDDDTRCTMPATWLRSSMRPGCRVSMTEALGLTCSR